MNGHSWYLFFVSLLCISDCLAQGIQPYFHQYTTEEGLPSSETYYLLQDRTGYIWIATDNGIARFDGYTFEVLGREEGLEDEVVFSIQEDREGKIWVSTYGGAVFYYQNERFHSFEHNELLRSMKQQLHLITLQDVSFPKGMLFSVREKGLFYLTPAGDVHWLTDQFSNGVYVYHHTESGQVLVYDDRISKLSDGVIVAFDPRQEKWDSIGVANAEAGRIVRALKGPESGAEQLLLVGSNEILLLENGAVKKEIDISLNPMPYAFQGQNDDYFLCTDSGGGLHYFRLLAGGEFTDYRVLLTEHSIAYGLFDRQGGLWVCSRDAGLFYAPYPEIAYFAEEQGLPKSKTLSLSLANDSVFFAGYIDGSVYYHNYRSGNSKSLFPEDTRQAYEASSLYFDQRSSYLYSNKYKFFYQTGSPLPIINRESYPATEQYVLKSIREFHGLSSQNERELLFDTYGALGALDLDEGTIEIIYKSPPGERLVFNAYYKDQNNDSWVGTLHGLNQFDEEEGAFSLKSFGQDALNKRVEEIVQLPNGAFIFGTRGSGLIYHARDTSYVINQSQGLVANNIRNLHLSSGTDLWVATLRGISKLQFDWEGNVKSIRSFGVPHGLVSEEVYDIQCWDESIWLATGKGVLQFRVPPPVSVSPAPIIQTLYVNGERCRECRDDELTLAHRDNNLTIEFRTINYRMQGQIQYRYRHQAAAAWQFTRQNQVNYIDLNPGQYLFEIQSQNQDGQWSRSSQMQFKIETPWFRHWLFQTGLVASAFGLFAFFFVQRDRRRLKDQTYLRKIDKLEKAALHAQMNPHFIFNSLTSIQNFILRNEKKKAVTYLAKFAHLIRMTLNVSMKGIHSLAEELDSINNYLNLEQIRYGQGFSYRVDVAANLLPTTILLPPLLIQPFIENAIKHGLKERKSGGKVEVLFSGKPELLEVRIIDNGIGIDLKEADTTNSAGMDITRRRLELMRHRGDSTPVLKIELLRDTVGDVAGTVIIIFIQTQQHETQPKDLTQPY